MPPPPAGTRRRPAARAWRRCTTPSRTSRRTSAAPGPVTIYFDSAGNRLRRPEVRLTPQDHGGRRRRHDLLPARRHGSGRHRLPELLRHQCRSAGCRGGRGALVIQAAGGPGSLAPRKVYERARDTATPVRVPNVRWIAGGVRRAGRASRSTATGCASPATSAWRLQPMPQKRSIASITFDATTAGLTWSPNPNRFSVSNANGVAITDMTSDGQPGPPRSSRSPSPRGAFEGGESFDFGESVFAPIQGIDAGGSGPLPRHEDHRHLDNGRPSPAGAWRSRSCRSTTSLASAW